MAGSFSKPGPGRPKGSSNKTTALAKEAIEQAFSALQGKKGKSLPEWAENNIDDFYKLIFPKLLPVQMQHSGNPDDRTPIGIVRLKGPNDA